MEIEKLLLRPDISTHFASMLSANFNPLIERYVKDSVSKTFLPAYSQQTAAMHQDILREMRAEILNVKKDSITWQTEAARSQEVCAPYLWCDFSAHSSAGVDQRAGTLCQGVVGPGEVFDDERVDFVCCPP